MFLMLLMHYSFTLCIFAYTFSSSFPSALVVTTVLFNQATISLQSIFSTALMTVLNITLGKLKQNVYAKENLFPSYEHQG